MTGIAEIDTAVAMNRANTGRETSGPMNSVGTRYPNPRPSAKGSTKPPTHPVATARPIRRMIPSRVSNPDSRTRKMTPSHPIISRSVRLVGSSGNSAANPVGHTSPNRDGPRAMPNTSSPTT